MIEQGSIEWHRQRIGMFTSSHLGDLMTTSKTKGQEFGDTAMAYIYKVAAERTIRKEFLEGSGFEMYLDRVNQTSKPIRWGNDFEDSAREEFSNLIGLTVNKAEFVKVNDYFGDSSDGWFENKEEEIIPIEIKCPAPATYKRYQQMKNGIDLLDCSKETKNYYYQCQGHMIAYGSDYCYFVAYDPMQVNPIHTVMVERDNALIELIEERLLKANELVNKINGFKQS